MYMKKALSWFLAILALSMGLKLPLEARAAQTDPAAYSSSSVDAVIVMDQSGSMRFDDPAKKNQSSDPQEYRLDAAQMMISMCDMSSRVAFLPFAGDVLDKYADSDFVALSTPDIRSKKLAQLEGLRGVNLGAETDVGAALSEAVKLLLERTDTTNRPMIIVLTDGQNEINDDAKGKYPTKTVQKWNDAAKSFIETKISNYSKNQANEIMDEATNVAMDNGIPIYSIALFNSSASASDVKAYSDRLRAMSAKTNGEFTQVNSRDASQLPEFFGEMFANQIGSNLYQGLEVEPVVNMPGRYKVELPILNRSVEEANIIVPLKSIKMAGKTSSVYLYDAAHDDVSGGRNDVLVLKSKYFLLYKIMQPKMTGTWSLEFDLADPNWTPADITFSLLYNYNISLKTMVGRGPADLAAADKGLALYKSETISIDTRFYNHDGLPTDDTNLYAVQPLIKPSDTWKTIRAEYAFRNKNGEVLFSGKLDAKADRFTAVIDLSGAYKTIDGQNQLTAGDYTLQIVADGAGLHRENAVQVKILNHAPEAKESTLKRIVYVDDPAADKAETREVQTVEINLSGNVSDLDNDTPIFGELKALGDARSIIDMKLEMKQDGSFAVVGKTIYADDNRKLFKSGTARYSIRVSDVEGLFTDLAIEVLVQSVTGDILGTFECQTVTQGLTGDVADKNSPVTFNMTLKRKAGGIADDTGAIKDFHGTLSVYDADNKSKLLYHSDFDFLPDDNMLQAIYLTPNTSMNIYVECNYTYGHTDEFAGYGTFAFAINNSPPKEVPAAKNALPAIITFGNLPKLISFLETPTQEKNLTIDLNNLFSDIDNEKKLELGDPYFSNDTLLMFKRDGDTVTLVPKAAGQLTLTFTAMDGDGEKAEILHQLTIQSVPDKWLRNGVIALVALIALIILTMLIHQARKPRYPRGGVLLIKENVAIFASERYEFSPSKKKIPLSHTMDEAFAQKFGISKTALGSLILKPARGYKDSIAILKTGKPLRVSVQLDGVDLGKKPLVWEKDQELILQAAGNTDCIKIQFTVEGDDVPEHDGFGRNESQDDGWNSPGSGTPFNAPAEDNGGF